MIAIAAALLLQAAPVPQPTAPGAAPSPVAAQSAPEPAYPFAVGESLSYTAKLGMLKLGTATLAVARRDTVRGTEAFLFRFQVRLKNMFYEADDVLESWVGTRDFSSRRFRKDFTEGKRRREEIYEIYPERGTYVRNDRDTTFSAPSDPIDDTAFFYFMRITPLEVGRTYTFTRYYRKEKNPITVKVVKRETMELPDGRKVPCLVLHPVVDTRGIFSKKSETRLWLTDDARRIPVQIRAKLPFGTVTLKLEKMAGVG